MKSKFLPKIFLLIYIILITIIIIIFFQYRKTKQDILLLQQVQIKKINVSKKFYQHIYQNFPIFEDWLNTQKTNQLRKFLYPYHIKIAKSLDLHLIKNTKDIDKNYLFIDNPEIRKYYFFYNVKKEFRYFYKDFIPVLILIGERFNQKINFSTYPVNVKLAISSVLRPENYQNQLKQLNRNAIENSTHSYGISLDIFYDEFFIDFSFLCNELNPPLQKHCIKEINHFGYILGGNLRRQLQSILGETLLELQNENKIYVILEKNQRIFHITPIP
ncbi:MAG: hypothetical protein KatS3mg129_1556 [Leptospiraceae bacterium]|nr:MAG: hypothetical protein KatS3mg129_1556 [Leptospiraceae bacterium]